MFFGTNNILKMDNNKLLKKIKESKYIGYRLGDIVLNYPCTRLSYIKNLYLPQKKKFSNSIAIKYTKLYKDEKSLGKKISLKESLNKNLEILKQLCDDISDIKPNENSLIATIRLGDMIEQNQEKKDGKKLAINGGIFYTPCGGTRYILSAIDIIKEAKDKNLDEVILVGSKAK